MHLIAHMNAYEVCSSHYIYLSVVSTDWTTAPKRTVRVTFLGVWERVVFDLIIPGL